MQPELGTVGRFGWYTDLVACPGSAGSRSRCTLKSMSEPQGLVLQVLTFLGGAKFITCRLRRAFLASCWRGPRHFSCYRACPGLQPYARTHLKKSTCATRLVGGTYDKYRLNAALLPLNQKQDSNSNPPPQIFIYLFCRSWNFCKRGCKIDRNKETKTDWHRLDGGLLQWF